MYSKLLEGLARARDRAIFMIACFCALRPSELFGLTWGSYQGDAFLIVNTAWRGQLQRKKIKRKNRFGGTNYRVVAIPQAVRHAIDAWRQQSPGANTDALMFPAVAARGRKVLATPMLPDNWLRLRLYPIAKKLALLFTPVFRSCGAAFPHTPDRNAGAAGPQRYSHYTEHLCPNLGAGGVENG